MGINVRGMVEENTGPEPGFPGGHRPFAASRLDALGRVTEFIMPAHGRCARSAHVPLSFKPQISPMR